jgi:hypothetical protein
MSDRISRKRLKEKALARWDNKGGGICNPFIRIKGYDAAAKEQKEK